MKPEELACKSCEVASMGVNKIFSNQCGMLGFERLGLQQICYSMLLFLCEDAEIFYGLNGDEHIMADVFCVNFWFK